MTSLYEPNPKPNPNPNPDLNSKAKANPNPHSDPNSNPKGSGDNVAGNPPMRHAEGGSGVRDDTRVKGEGSD